MGIRLLALFAISAAGCALDAPVATTDSPGGTGAQGDAPGDPTAESADEVVSSPAAGVTPNALGDWVSIDLYVGSTQVGYAQVTTTSASSRALRVCAFRNSGTTVVAEVDPGSGVLQQFQNTSAQEDCTNVGLASIRKFRAFIWHLTPPPGSGVALGLGLSRNQIPGDGPIVGSATIGYPGGAPDIHVCAVSGFGTMNSDIDPGSGQLALYQATNGCTDHNPGTSLRKFRAWYWTLPPGL